jgi:hypothetical protein
VAGTLGKRFAAGDGDVANAVVAHAREDFIHRHPLAAGEGVGGVAVAAAQRAAGQAHEHGGPAHRAGLALQGEEDLGDAQAVGVGLC